MSVDSCNISTTLTKNASPVKATLEQITKPRKSWGADKLHDPDWAPGAKQTGAKKRTYGGRPTKKPGTAQISITDVGVTARPGEIAFTPLIARTSNRILETPRLDTPPLKRFKRGGLVAQVEQIKNIKKQLPADIGKLIEGLLDAYAKLLQATHLGEEKSRKGARSLLGACLQKIPAYIELEEYFAELGKEKAEEDEDRDISDEIYTYLEQTFETHTGQGWRHFKRVVRAHGTSLLCDAFADEILEVDALHAVVDLCLKASAWDEAERFLWTFLPRLKPISTPANLSAILFHLDISVFMHLARVLTERTGRHGFMYDLLEHLVSQEILPLEWFATDCMRPIWNRLVRTLTEGDPRTFGHAFRFLETTLCYGIGLPDESIFQDGEVDVVWKQIKPSVRQELRDALDTTFSTLLTILASVTLASQNRVEDTEGKAMEGTTWILDCIVIGLLRRKDARSDLDLLNTTTENMHMFAQRALWAMVASTLVHLEGCSLPTTMVSLDAAAMIRTFGWVTYHYSCHDIDIPALFATLPGFISSIARCTGKAWRDDGFDQLQRLVTALLSIRGLRLPHKLWTLKRLALETCLEFAQNTNNSEHFSYAREIEKLMSSKGKVVLQHSPLKNDTPSTTGGFRWEEGIGEWVVCTPFRKQDIGKLPRKPLRPLELLPTPEPSDSSQVDMDGDFESGLQSPVDEDGVSSEDDNCPQSSPLKKAPITILRGPKRIRAPSPMVIIQAKRRRLTPPNSASSSFSSDYLVFTSGLDGIASPVPRRGTRNPRRAKKQNHISAKGLRIVRSRSSLGSSLRNIAPKEYVDNIESDESEREESGEEDEDNNDYDGHEDDGAETSDELWKTPAGMKTRAKVGRSKPVQQKRGKGRRPNHRWALAAGSEGDDSEDELSFQ